MVFARALAMKIRIATEAKIVLALQAEAERHDIASRRFQYSIMECNITEYNVIYRNMTSYDII